MSAIGLFELMGKNQEHLCYRDRALAAIYESLGEEAADDMLCARCRKCAEVKKLRNGVVRASISQPHH